MSSSCGILFSLQHRSSHIHSLAYLTSISRFGTIGNVSFLVKNMRSAFPQSINQ